MANDGGDVPADGSRDVPGLVDRATRVTRGKRITKLLDEEIEQDELFWNQDSLKEEENDDNYEAEPDIADVFDSDFDEDEDDNDGDTDNVPEERLPVKKRLIFPGKVIGKKKSKKRKVLAKIGEVEKVKKSSDRSINVEHLDIPNDLETERTVRKSTRTSVVLREAQRAERESILAAVQAALKPNKKKKDGEEKRITQEEMLLEAAETELKNLRNLERVLAREEEVKKKAIFHKEVYDGPQIRFCSRDGNSYLEFIGGASFQSEICTTSVPYPEKAVCVITGLPAKYKDPMTGLPYATLEAFKVIQERFRKAESDEKKAKDLEMGELANSISANSSLGKRKRSSSRKPERQPNFRAGAPFRKIQLVERQDGEE